jgi:hypothetical protein
VVERESTDIGQRISCDLWPRSAVGRIEVERVSLGSDGRCDDFTGLRVEFTDDRPHAIECLVDREASPPPPGRNLGDHFGICDLLLPMVDGQPKVSWRQVRGDVSEYEFVEVECFGVSLVRSYDKPHTVGRDTTTRRTGCNRRHCGERSAGPQQCSCCGPCHAQRVGKPLLRRQYVTMIRQASTVVLGNSEGELGTHPVDLLCERDDR